MSARHSPVYRKKAASTKSYRKVPLKQEIAAFGDGEDFTKAINSADSLRSGTGSTRQKAGGASCWSTPPASPIPCARPGG